MQPARAVRTSLAVLIVLACLASSHPARADDAASPAAAPTPDASAGPRRPGAATAWAWGATLTGAALVAGGALALDRLERGAMSDIAGGALAGGVVLLAVGPSAGHLYAGERRHATLATLTRVGGAVIFLAASMSDTDCVGSSSSCDDGIGLGHVLGAGLVAGAITYDLVDAPRAARRANRRAAARAAVVPTAVRAADGLAPGLAVAGAF